MDSRAMPLCAWLQYGHRPEPPCFQVVASSRCLTDKPVGSRLCRGSFAVAMPHALVQGFDPDEFFFTPRLRYCLYIALAHSRNYGLPALPRAFFCLRIRNSRLTEGFLEQHKNRPPFEMRVLRFNTNSIRCLDLSRRHRLLRFGEHGLFQPRSPVKRQRRQ